MFRNSSQADGPTVPRGRKGEDRAARFLPVVATVAQSLYRYSYLVLGSCILWLAMPVLGSAQTTGSKPPGTVQQDPRRPPGTSRPDPQAPPGTSGTPKPSTPARQDSPLVSDPITQRTSPSPDDTALSTSLTQTPQPMPPMPSLKRVGVRSDEPLPLTLMQAIRRALENNNEIEMARDDVRREEQVLFSLEGVYDFRFLLTPQINNSVIPQESVLGGATNSSGGTVKTTDISFDSSLNKQLTKGGGRYDFFFNNNRRNTNSIFNALNNVYSSSFGVTFTQPLWRDRKIDNTRRGIRIQRKKLQQLDADFRRRTIEIIADVQLAYWELTFALRNEQNQLSNLGLARESFRRIELSIAAGAGAPLQRAEVKTELAARESALLLASQYVSVAENRLKTLILVNPLAPEWSNSLVPTDQPAFDSTPVDLEGALLEGKTNRPELLRLQLQRSVNDIDLDYFKDQTKPRVELQATLSTTGLAGFPLATIDPLTGESSASLAPDNLRGGYYRDVRNLLGLKTHNIVVGLTIEFPLHNRSAKANLAAAQIERQQLDANVRFQGLTIEEQVRNSVQAIETARQRVLSARAGSESARLQLRGEQRLFEVGRSTTFLLIQRENQLIAARTQELRAETDYSKAVAELQRSTFTTLQANNVVVLTPLAP